MVGVEIIHIYSELANSKGVGHHHLPLAEARGQGRGKADWLLSWKWV